MASNSLLFCLENSKARSNDFAEKNGLQKYEYVLHPRTTGFTFVVERLREGKHSSQKATFLCKWQELLNFVCSPSEFTKHFFMLFLQI